MKPACLGRKIAARGAKERKPLDDRMVMAQLPDQVTPPLPSESANPEHDLLISQFVTITGADLERGKLYLESTGFQLERAIAAYYEEVDERAVREQQIQSQFVEQQAEQERIESSVRVEPNIFTPPETDMSDDKKQRDSTGGRRIATLDSLHQEDQDMESDEEPGQAFYAGGSDRSGQQVLGPPRKKDPEKIVKSMFESAKKHGGQVVEPEEPPKHQSVPFKGTGNRLGTSDEPSPAAAVSPIKVPFDHPTGPPSVDMVLKLWRNGFSLDDGTLRPYEDPANAEFLQSIKAGEIPKELLNSSKGEVNLNMEDHRNEEFKETKKPVQSFSGEGQRLGSVAPETVIAAVAQTKTSKDDEEAAQRELSLDPSKPVTNIKIRLADGSMLVMKINTDQKVGKIREFICRARPNSGFQPFALMTAFPKKELDKENQTIQEADLTNATISQRFI